MKNTYGIAAGIGGLIMGALGLYAGIKAHKETNALCKTLNTTLDDAVKATEITIPDELVQRSVDRAVRTESDKAVRRAVDGIMTEQVVQIRSQIREAVKDQESTIAHDVAERLAVEVGKIGDEEMRRLKREAVSKASFEVANRLEEDLDDVKGKYMRQLENVGTIYTEIAKKFKEA